MKKEIDKIQLDIYNSKALDLYLKDKTFAVFDIETTGLSPKHCSLILSGIMINKGASFEVLQYFAQTIEDEKLVIEETFKILETVDYIITYNGKHFDLPFLITRAEMLGIEVPILPFNLDIYLILNGHSPLKEVLPNLKQKSVELFMDVADTRDDLISGAESIKLYNEYLESSSHELEKSILLHNHDDLIQLYKIMPVLDKCDLHKAMYKLGFDAGNYRIIKIILNGNFLNITGLQKKDSIDYISFPSLDTPYQITMNKNNSQFEIILPVSKEAGALYIDTTQIFHNNVETIKKYPSYVNGYLIFSEDNSINHLSLNTFIKEFLERLNII